jgi:hypothetical protein
MQSFFFLSIPQLRGKREKNTVDMRKCANFFNSFEIGAKTQVEERKKRKQKHKTGIRFEPGTRLTTFFSSYEPGTRFVTSGNNEWTKRNSPNTPHKNADRFYSCISPHLGTFFCFLLSSRKKNLPRKKEKKNSKLINNPYTPIKQQPVCMKCFFYCICKKKKLQTMANQIFFLLFTRKDSFSP